MKLAELFEKAYTAEEAMANFKNKDAVKYAKKMIDTFGEPIDVAHNHLHWKEADGMKDIILRDESIPHDFPSQHRDFIYSSREVEVPEHLYSVFAHVTGSIVLDGLKKTATARCGALMANAITLQFVQDVVDGKAPQTPEEAKEEYAKRIKCWKAPTWYKNKTKD